MDCRQCQATQQASVKQSSLRVALLSSKQANMHVDQWWTIGVDLTSQCFQVEEQSLASSTSWAISEPSSWTSHTGSQLLQQSQAVHTRDIFLEAWCGLPSHLRLQLLWVLLVWPFSCRSQQAKQVLAWYPRQWQPTSSEPS